MITSTHLVPLDRAVAREAGFRFSLFLTRAVYEDCVAWTDDDTRRIGALQDREDRLWDVLSLAADEVRELLARNLHQRAAEYTLYRVPRDLDRTRLAELEDDPDELVAQPVRLVIRRDPCGLVIDLAEAVA